MNARIALEAAAAMRALRDPRLFTERYLQNDPDPEKQIQYLEWYQQVDRHLEQHDDVLVLVYPGSGKSTRLSFIETLQAICRDRSIRIGFFSKTESKAKLFMLNVARELRTNQRIIRDFGVFFDPRDKDCYDSQSMIRVSGAGGKEKEPTIINFGAASQFESLRLDLLILDDPVDLKSSRSRAETQWMDKTLGSLMDRMDEGGRIIIVGHRFLPHDFYQIVLESRPTIAPLVLKAMDEDGNPLAHEIWTKAGLEKRKKSKKKWEWQAYYMQAPVPPEDAVFRDIKMQDVMAMPEGGVKASAMDPAYTEALMDDPDWSVAMTGMPYKNGILITDIQDWRINRGWASKFCTFAHDTGGQTASVEINNAQTLGVEMQEYCSRNRIPVTVKPFKSKRGKEYRIGDLADWARENGVYFLERVTTTPGFQRLKEQWDNYPNTNHDDHLDCLDMLRRAIKSGVRVTARVAHI